MIGDIWKAEQRGPAVMAYSMAVAGGPLFAPIAGDAIVESGAS